MAILTVVILTTAILLYSLKVSAVYSTLSRRNAKAQTDALALSADVAEQVGVALTPTKPTLGRARTPTKPTLPLCLSP